MNGLMQQGDLIRMLSGLFLVILIIVLMSWGVKKLQGLNIGVSKGLKPLAQLPMGSKERVVLVMAGPRYLLLGVTTGSINLIHDFGEQLPPGFDREDSSSFSEIFKKARGKSNHEI